jgi:hypothetical protein
VEHFNCTPAASKCTLLPPKEVETGYGAEVTATGSGNGSLVIGGGGAGKNPSSPPKHR